MQRMRGRGSVRRTRAGDKTGQEKNAAAMKRPHSSKSKTTNMKLQCSYTKWLHGGRFRATGVLFYPLAFCYGLESWPSGRSFIAYWLSKHRNLALDLGPCYGFTPEVPPARRLSFHPGRQLRSQYFAIGMPVGA